MALATLLLLVPAIANGYPLVFPDTGTYLRQAIELHGAADRPPFYSLLIFPFHMRISLWPVAAMQAVSVTLAIRVVMKTLVGEVSARRYVGTVALLTLLTSLPWHVGQIVPDAFTPFLALLAFELAYSWKRYAKWERVLLSVVACGVTTLHFSHLPLAIGLFLVAAFVRLAQGYGISDAVRVLMVGGLVTTVASLAFLAYSYALVHKLRLSPSGNLFAAARMLADGPGRRYLVATCPESGNVFCAYQDRLTDNIDVFLWRETSPLVDALKAHGAEAVDRSSGEIVAGVLNTRLFEQLRAAVGNAARQFVRFGTLDTSCPERCGEGEGVNVAVTRFFAGDYARFQGSRQMRGSLPLAIIRGLDSATVAVSAFMLALLAFGAFRRHDTVAVGLAAIVVATLALNAGVTGALSGVYDRYQSRVIWLLPFAAILLWQRRWRREPARPVMSE